MLTRNHPFWGQFKSLILECASAGTIYDIGTSSRFAKEIGFLKDVIDPLRYRAIGFNPDLSIEAPCDAHGNICDLVEIPTGTIDSIVCLEVLEHVADDPQRAVNELFRILRPGGTCILSTPYLTSYHGKREPSLGGLIQLGMHEDSSHEGYGDFWRFTHEGLAFMFMRAGFSSIEVWPTDGPLLCRLEIMNLARLLLQLPGFKALIERLDRPRLGRATTRHFVRAKKGNEVK
jgi:SAM-dependent methyltransferase